MQARKSNGDWLPDARRPERAARPSARAWAVVACASLFVAALFAVSTFGGEAHLDSCRAGEDSERGEPVSSESRCAPSANPEGAKDVNAPPQQLERSNIAPARGTALAVAAADAVAVTADVPPVADDAVAANADVPPVADDAVPAPAGISLPPEPASDAAPAVTAAPAPPPAATPALSPIAGPALSPIAHPAPQKVTAPPAPPVAAAPPVEVAEAPQAAPAAAVIPAAAAAAPVLATANLKTTVSGPPTSVLPGDLLTYVATITNEGPGTAGGVVVQAAIPGLVSLISATSEAGTCDGPNCEIGALGAGAGTTVAIIVEVNDDANGDAKMVICASTADNDPQLGDNCAEHTTVIAGTGPTASPTATALAEAESPAGGPTTGGLPGTEDGGYLLVSLIGLGLLLAGGLSVFAGRRYSGF